MKFLAFLFVLAISAFGLASASRNQIQEEKINQLLQKIDIKGLFDKSRADASEFVDLLLANLRELMIKEGLDTMDLPGIVQGFEHKFLGIIWRGEFSLHDGKLGGLATVRRTGNCEVDLVGGDVLINCEIGFTQPNLGYSGHVTFMDLGPRITVTGQLSQVRAQIVLRVFNDLRVRLDKLDVKNTGILSLEIKGLGFILNFLAEIILEVIGNVIKPIVVLIMEGVMRDLINQILEDLFFPPDSYKLLQESISQAVGYVKTLEHFQNSKEIISVSRHL